MEDTPIRADRVKTKRVKYLWPTDPNMAGRIPKGMVTVIAGRANQGKGLFAAHVAAEVSRLGTKVLYSAREDDKGSMTRPRLLAAEANMKNILLWKFLRASWDDFEQIVRQGNIGLVVMDPLASHLSHGVNRHSDNIRVVTDALADMIAETGTSVLIVEHVVKAKMARDGDPLMMIGGSGSGVAAAARAAYAFGKDPQDNDRHILAHLKLNVAEEPDAIVFSRDTREVLDADAQPYLEFEEEVVGYDAGKLFRKEKGSIGRPPDKKAAAAEWLAKYLALAGGPVKSSVVFEDAKQYQMSSKTLRRAAADLKIVKSAGGGPNVTWDLPQGLKDAMGLTNDSPTIEDTIPPPPPGAPDGDTDGRNWEQALEDLLKQQDEDNDSE